MIEVVVFLVGLIVVYGGFKAVIIVDIFMDWKSFVRRAKYREMYGWATFKLFKKFFNESNLECNINDESFVDSNNLKFSSVSSDNIVFSDKYMILGFIDYLRFRRFIYKLLKEAKREENRKKVVDWSMESLKK